HSHDLASFPTRRSSDLFQIVQSPQAVVIQQELIHDARVVPMSGAPHLPNSVRQLHGDSRGHWEGDTLVVETTNYLDGFRPGFQRSEEHTSELQSLRHLV